MRMMHARVRGLVLAALVTFLLFPAPAFADAIDGSWCHNDGRKLSILGSLIVTPKGSRAEGIYSRHAFSYQVPPSDPEAGAQIRMVLINDDQMHLLTGKANSGGETWRRCGPPVS